MSLRERLLIRKLRERDPQAFREIVSRYRDRVYNLTYRMLGSHEEAEDLAQETFITVFKSIDTFRGDAKFGTWLYRITANLCKNRIKYLSRRHHRNQAEYNEEVVTGGGMREAQLTTGTPTPSPQKQLETMELEQFFRQAIQSLDEDQRLLVVLRDIEGLHYEEIFSITNVPVGTIKSRLHRARMILRKKMLSFTSEPKS